MLQNKKIVVIGGGTGTFSVLSGLKKYTDQITAIVSMADSGGSARKERDEWGLLPSSDIRKSLLALSSVSTKDSIILRRLFQYRYSEGTGVSGMSFGNLFLVALTKLLGSQEKAIETAGKILKIRGRVLPVTDTKCDLVATYADGSKVVGEHFIDQPLRNGEIKITNLETVPTAFATEDVKKAIEESDSLILGPGGFYTTIVANLVIKGVTDAIKKSRVKVIFILNLMTEFGQTYGFTASKFVQELDRYLPMKYIDYIIANNAPIPPKILEKYKKFHAVPVITDFGKSTPFKVISADLISEKIIKKEKGDLLQRSLIRHDPEKLASLCINLLI